MVFEPGYDKGCTFKTDAANSPTTLEVKSWNWEESVDPLDTTHTNSSGIQEMIRGVFRGTGNVTAVIDSSAYPTNTAPGIKAGTKGYFTFDGGLTNNANVHVLVTKLRWQNEVAGLLQYNFDFVLDGTSGTYTYPS